MRKRLLAITGGEPIGPLVVLFGLNLVDELDRLAFGIMGPDIGETFGLSDGNVVLIATLVAIPAVAAVLPLSYLADRFNRVRIVVFAAMSWMALSVLTGLAGWAGLLGVLIIARLGAGIGRAVNEPVHSSLLPDYYSAERLPAVFTFHRIANPVAALTAIIIGVIGALLGWEALFIVLAIPTALLILSALRLPNPDRGTMIDAELARESEAQGAVPFAEARRQLFGIRALKRLYLGGFLLGFGVFPLAIFTVFFFENVFGFDSVGLGIVTAVSGVGLFAGLLLGERVVSRGDFDNPGRLATLTGLNFMLAGIGLFLMAVSPVSGLAILFVFVTNMGFSGYLPAYLPLIAMIVPPKVRTQAFGYSLILLACGGALSALILGNLGDSVGYRMAIAIMSGIVLLAGLVGTTARGFVRKDVANAAKSLSAARDLMAAREAGDGALLICRGVEVAYDQVQVLFGVDMVVKPGECVALLGTNGAGKSTLLKAISGVVDPIGGAIFFDGRDITHTDGVATTALGVIQVPGGKAVFPTLTVAEHLRAAGWLYRDDPEYLKTANAEVLRTFPRLEERIDQMAGNLSGGEQQMLALGMAFIAKPKLLMIDELSLGLAPTIVEQLLGIVRRIQEAGTAIVLVEQSINVALTVADRAYFLEKGEVRFEGLTEELLERNDIVRSVFLEGAGSVRGDTPAKVAATAARQAPVVLEPVLELDSVTKRFGGITAVNDASFVLNRGEILGLIGPNGAGKTTIFDLVSGFLPLTHGRIRFDGEDITSMSPDRRAWLGLGRSFQDARLAGSLTVAENIAIGLERHLDVRDHLASMLNLPGVAQQEEDVAWTVADLIELMHLGAFRDKFVRELSTGSRRIVDLAMCMAHDPSVLLLDEPSSGIAQAETEALGPLLQRIQVETDCALLVIEHDMPLITGVSDRMIALELGHPIVEGTPQEVIAHPRVIESYLGGDPAVINRSGKVAEPAAAKPPAKPKPATKRRAPLKAASKPVAKKPAAKKAVAKKAAPARVRGGQRTNQRANERQRHQWHRRQAGHAGRRREGVVMRRRLVLLLAAASLLLGSALVFGPAHADPAASIDDSGWWWRAQTSDAVLLPGPPNVEKGQLLVQSGPEGAMALAAVAGTLVDGEANPVLTMKVADGGDAGGEGAVIVACQAGSTWKGGDAKAWAEHPTAGCEAGSVKGTRSEDGTSWSFDLSSLQFTDKVNVVIVPGTIEGQPEGANYSTFSLTFEPVSTEALATTPGEPSSSLPPIDGGITDPGVGAGVGFDTPSLDTGSLDLPPVAALPDEDQGLTSVAPSVQAEQPLMPASVVLDPRRKEAKAVGIALLLLGSALVYAMTRQQPQIGPEGVPGGLGRWASPRWGTPPSLRG